MAEMTDSEPLDDSLLGDILDDSDDEVDEPFVRADIDAHAATFEEISHHVSARDACVETTASSQRWLTSKSLLQALVDCCPHQHLDNLNVFLNERS